MFSSRPLFFPVFFQVLFRSFQLVLETRRLFETTFAARIIVWA